VVTGDPVKLVELLASLSLATDLGTGQPMGHGIRTAVVAAGIARQLGLHDGDVDAVRLVALLRFLGCTADTTETARMLGGDDLSFLAEMAPVVMGGSMEAGRRLVGAVGRGEPAPRRVRLLAGALADRDGMRRSLTSHCEVAARLAQRLGLAGPVVEALGHGYERWDGGGFPDRLSGEAIPLPVRIAVVARDADLQWRSAPDALAGVLRARRGRGYDPAVVDAFIACGRDVLAQVDREDPWPIAVSDPAQRLLAGEELHAALAAVGDFADLKSPHTRGHSARVAELAAAAADISGTVNDPELLRRAAWVADLGRVGVPNGVWDHPGPLGVADWERVRLHPYLTERILSRCPPLTLVGRVAAAHHERLDGSGYHRGARSHDLDTAARLLAVADVVAAMGEPRGHRPAHPAPEITRHVEREVREGRLDATAAHAVLTAAGHPRSPAGRRGAGPLALTEREIDVLRLIARGHTNRDVAATLHLSPKTVGRHIENVYTKIGVSTRAAAALVAMEHGLLDR
jgi:HD-GYP domain-containing protein (c-di-GMP phosphodiesterase class II)